MESKIISFLATLGLIVWNAFDISRSENAVLNWIIAGMLVLLVVFEAADIISSRKSQKPNRSFEGQGRMAP